MTREAGCMPQHAVSSLDHMIWPHPPYKLILTSVSLTSTTSSQVSSNNVDMSLNLLWQMSQIIRVHERPDLIGAGGNIIPFYLEFTATTASAIITVNLVVLPKSNITDKLLRSMH
eukprot:scaffold61629_cov43-Cyclotella_meneghiniana.AAC.1